MESTRNKDVRVGGQDRDMPFLPRPGLPYHSHMTVRTLICPRTASGGAVDTEATAVSLLYSYGPQRTCCHGNGPALDQPPSPCPFIFNLSLQDHPQLHLTPHPHS